MLIYTVIVLFLNFSVNFLIIIASSCICGMFPRYRIAVLSSLLNCALTFAGMKWGVFGSGFVRATGIVLCTIIAFGIYIESIRPCVVALLLHLAVSCVAGNNIFRVLTAILCVFGVIFVIRFRKDRPGAYIPLEINYRGKNLKIEALRDTGNLLTDPLTGHSVIILCCDCAQMLTGLSKQQLQNPVDTIAEEKFPGLRLLPYATIGNPNGILLAISIRDVCIGRQKGSRLVALAPDNFCDNGRYQAITGGCL